jgi:DNA-binding response OmpR family regulator
VQTSDATANANLVLQLRIELPQTSETVAALAELLDGISALPGAVLKAHDEGVNPAELVPRPRSFSRDDQRERLFIDPGARRLLLCGLPVDLTRREFDLLLFLASKPDLVHRRSALLAQVWDVTEPYGSRTVDVHIRRLREKLGSFGRLITTVRGVGYRLDESHLVTITQPVHS